MGKKGPGPKKPVRTDIRPRCQVAQSPPALYVCWGRITGRADPRPTSHPVTNLISHNGIILYQWEFLRARLDEGEGLPWIAMEHNNNKLQLTTMDYR